MVTLPTADVPATPVTETAFPIDIDTLPTADVPATPVTSIKRLSSQASSPQVPRPQPVTIAKEKLPYAILMIALLASAVGKTIWKSPELEDLSPPKSKTKTASVVLEPPAV